MWRERLTFKYAFECRNSSFLTETGTSRACLTQPAQQIRMTSCSQRTNLRCHFHTGRTSQDGGSPQRWKGVPFPPGQHASGLASLCGTEPGWCSCPSRFWLDGYLRHIRHNDSVWKNSAYSCVREREKWKDTSNISVQISGLQLYLPELQTIPLESLF